MARRAHRDRISRDLVAPPPRRPREYPEIRSRARHDTNLLRWVRIQRGSWSRPGERHVLAGARIALCHEWTMSVAGSEKVASALADITKPDAVFTLAADPEVVAELFPGCDVWAPSFGLRSGVQRRWTSMLPLLHALWSSLSLERFDVVVTSSHSCVNAVRTGRRPYVVCYCHTPMRYAWAWRHELSRVPAVLRPAWPAAAAVLRGVDRAVARKVGRFIANSAFVSKRILDAYGMPSDIVHPPVDTAFFTPPTEPATQPYAMVAGRLVAYKRTDIAVRAARLAGVPLVVAGSGPLLDDLRREAAPDTVFVERASDRELRDLYRRARALIFPGVEDFGITIVEAMACGTPVVAYARGGATETVASGVSGVLVDAQTPDAFAEAIRRLPPRWDRDACRRVAVRFGPETFRRRITDILTSVEDRMVRRRAYAARG